MGGGADAAGGTGTADGSSDDDGGRSREKEARDGDRSGRSRLWRSWPGPRVRKFRQAAFVYLHVGILYEFAVWVFADRGLLPTERGPVWVWLLVGALIVAFVVRGLWSWQNEWVARVVWGLHALRLPALIEGAFFPAPAAGIPPSFYLTAVGVVLVNLWMLARAGWDL